MPVLHTCKFFFNYSIHKDREIVNILFLIEMSYFLNVRHFWIYFVKIKQKKKK